MLLLLATSGLAADAAPPPLPVWPAPARVRVDERSPFGFFSLARPQLTVSAPNAAAKSYLTRLVDAVLMPALGCPPREQGSTGGSGATDLRLTVADGSCTSPACFTHETGESYTLALSGGAAGLRPRIDVMAQSVAGAARAAATLASLAGAGRCAISSRPLRIVDVPRFGHRGLLLDTSRHYMAPADIRKKVLDPMWRAKLNVLHWHIADAQAQPLVLADSGPLAQLTLPEARGRVYRRADVVALVDYAFARGIRILPEFDMPGHTAVLAKAVPELVSCFNHVPWDGTGEWALGGIMCNQPPCGQLRPSPKGTALARSVMAAVRSLFPNYLVSSGADEVNFNCWAGEVVQKNDSRYPAFYKHWRGQLAAFQAAVLGDTLKDRRSKGEAPRRPAVWDESFSDLGFAGTPALPRGTVLFTWAAWQRAPEMTAAGYDIVYTPYRSFYLDCGMGTAHDSTWCDPLNNWTAIYQQDIFQYFKTTGNRSRVLGAETALWTEHVPPEIADYALWPRAAALAERLWSPHAAPLPDAARRLQRFVDQLRAAGLRPSPLGWSGRNMRLWIMPAWCDANIGKALDHAGVDYCASAATYQNVTLTFERLLINPDKG